MNAKNLLIEYLLDVDKLPYIVGIDGGTSSGKTYFLKKILKDLRKLKCDYLSFEIDDYSIERSQRIYPKKKYFDMKKWYNLDLIANHILKIKKGPCIISMPTYNHKTGKKGSNKKIKFNGNQIVFLNGIYSLDKRIRLYIDLKILIDTRPKIRLKREIYRNVNKRFQDKSFVIKRFKEAEEPTYKTHYKDIKRYVDLIINNNDWGSPQITYASNKFNKYLK